jgi:hypothetical protein
MSRSNLSIPPLSERVPQVPVETSEPQHERVRQIDNYHRSVPAWLRSLLSLQRGATVIFGLVFGASALGYGYTVYTQDIWKRQHQQLRQLQTQERQQGVMTENLNHQYAIAAEHPQNKLLPPDPKKIVVVPSAPLRPTKPLPPTSQLKSAPPSGY